MMPRASTGADLPVPAKAEQAFWACARPAPREDGSDVYDSTEEYIRAIAAPVVAAWARKVVDETEREIDGEPDQAPAFYAGAQVALDRLRARADELDGGAT